MESQKARIPNELIKESSPYLLQHAYNPVKWKPFTDEAWDLAKKEDKLVIVSIGYAACHWCHVMEKECFEDESLAQFMNENFICIKVDREERPDVDHIYMEACTIMTKKGGWPLNIFALPDARPVYAGTYFPKNSWQGLLKELSIGYKKDKNKYLEFANKLELAIKESNSKQFISQDIQNPLLEDSKIALQNAIYAFDKTNGGKGRAPKFPMPNNILWMLNSIPKTEYQSLNDLKFVTELTLQKMLLGGIYDQIGGGFARYSVDDEWHIPHFEKMLYDNAQLLELYGIAYQKGFLPEICSQAIQGIYSWLHHEMFSGTIHNNIPINGAYYSSMDADSEGVEGKFYVFNSEELKEILSESEYLFASSYFSVDKASLWEDENNHLRRIQTDKEFIELHSFDELEFLEVKNLVIQKIFNYREQRIKPGTDNKIILSWNALLISGFVEAYIALKQEKFKDAAIQLMDFLSKTFVKDEKIIRTFRSGIPIYGFLEDYATYIQSLLQMYKITFDENYLMDAKYWMEQSLLHFNTENDFFYYSTNEDNQLFTSKIEIQDNVIPASNSMMAKNLFLLGKIFSIDEWIERSEKMVAKVLPHIKEYGNYFSNWALLMQFQIEHFYEVVLSNFEDIDKLSSDIILNNPDKNIFILKFQESSNIPQLEGKNEKGLYICVNKSCLLPVQDINNIKWVV